MKIDGKYTTAIVYTDEVEQTCLDQIKQMVNNEQFTNPIAIMPDCHAGYGSVIGFTMKLGDKLAPNVVGVDIGCGMLALNLGNEVVVRDAVGTSWLDDKVREKVPMGFSIRSVAIDGHFEMFEICERVGADITRALKSVGTLGGGNHFIEFSESIRTGDIWLIIHSGSRNFGKRICDYWQKQAKGRVSQKVDFSKQVNEIKATTSDPQEIGRKIADLKGGRTQMEKGLEFLEGEELAGYLRDMKVAQLYAKINRRTIADIITVLFPDAYVSETIESVHNYVSFSDNIIRKGAIRCVRGRQAIIPLNMRDGTFLVEGKGNPEWNYSAPHGAGRVLSRTAAKAKIPMEDFVASMEGIYSQSVVESTLDEAPMAYKDASLIESTIDPTAEIIDRLMPLHNIKAC